MQVDSVVAVDGGATAVVDVPVAGASMAALAGSAPAGGSVLVGDLSEFGFAQSSGSTVQGEERLSAANAAFFNALGPWDQSSFREFVRSKLSER